MPLRPLRHGPNRPCRVRREPSPVHGRCPSATTATTEFLAGGSQRLSPPEPVCEHRPMSSHDDPEERIRDLERSLSEQSTELTHSVHDTGGPTDAGYRPPPPPFVPPQQAR